MLPLAGQMLTAVLRRARAMIRHLARIWQGDRFKPLSECGWKHDATKETDELIALSRTLHAIERKS
jgi:hypothetical protein